MKILVPTDFSETADNALQYAIKFFNKPDNTFILYHSFMPFESGFYSHKKSEEENYHEESELKNTLKEKADNFSLKNEKTDIEIFVDRGIAESNILKYAKKHKIELIVMGTTGATGLKEKLVGSVTANVMNQSDCPVIGIPENYELGALSKIAFCSNYQLDDINALKYLIRLSKNLQVKIHIWHFYKKAAESDDGKNLSSEYKTMIGKFFENEKFTFHFPETDNIEDEFDKLSERKDLDMIALITHKRKGFFNSLLDKSLTKRVAYHSKVPLLAIPSELNE